MANKQKIVNEYEALRNKNLEDNKVMLEKLMSDIKGSLPPMLNGGTKVVQKKQKSHKSRLSLGESVRRNPGRNARYDPVNVSPPRTRSRRGSLSSVSSSGSSLSASSTSPDSASKMVVRFGFLGKKQPADSGESSGMEEEDFPEPKQHRHVIHDTRSAEEITEEDLALVATFVSEKQYDTFYGSSCHQCRQKTNDMKTICRSNRCFGVRGQFCGPCLRNRYGEDAKEALKNPSWECPPCRGICNCSFCRKKKGKSCTGILIHVAREHGFADVNAYLQSLRS